MQLCKVQIGTGMQVQESATQQLTEAVKVWQHERNMMHLVRETAESAQIEGPTQQRMYESVYLGKPAC